MTGWTGVAQWKWIANDDNCGICRNAFDGCCTDCKMPGDDCPLGNVFLRMFHAKLIITNALFHSVPSSLSQSVGPVFTLFPHPLHHEMVKLATCAPVMSNVSSGMEIP